MATLHLKIVTPEKVIFDDETDQVNIPTTEGELGILPHHANLMAQLIPGELTIKNGERQTHMAVGTGFIQITNNILTIMTDLAVNAADIDERKVEEARKRAEEAMSKTLSDEEHAATLATLQKSVAQLKVKRHHHLR